MSKFEGLDKFADKLKVEEVVKEAPEPVSKLYEKREKSILILVTPSTHAALKELKKRGVIKSANDLVNDLLGEYIDKHI